MAWKKIKVGFHAVVCCSVAASTLIAVADEPASKLNVVNNTQSKSTKPAVIDPYLLPVQDVNQPPTASSSAQSGSDIAPAPGTRGNTQGGFAPPALTGSTSPASSGTTDTTNTNTVSVGGQNAGVVNSQGIGEFLSKSADASGVDIQQRNAISSDPRVRGYRVGQLVTLGDGAFYFPVRQDLDTAISKFDPSSVRDVVIFRGPYTSMYGPGLAFLDVATLDSPRYDCGYEVHGRTGIRYQTNGNRWDAVQSISMGDRTWGARITYDFLQGTDYQAAQGIYVPGDYLSHNVNVALGFDLSDKSSIEFKAIHLRQSDVEYPGLYFDVKQLVTEAYSLRYTLRDQNAFDKFTLDTWYNSTTASGFTARDQKQQFVSKLLNVSFNPDQPISTQTDQYFNQFSDQSTSDMSNKSMGYRAAMWWGKDAKCPQLVIGTDLSVLGQNLVENIQFTQLTGNDLNTGEPITGPTVYNQRQTIPNASLINPGIFAELRMPFGDMFTVRAGGRLDWVNTTSGSRLITGNVNIFGSPTVLPPDNNNLTVVDPIEYSVNPITTSNTRDFQLYSAFLTGDWKLDEYVTLSAGYAHANRAPTMTELYAAGPFLGVLQQGTSRLIGDPNLDPETLNQFDLGLRANYGWARGSVTGYYAFINNYITYDQNKGGVGLNQLVFANTDLATLAGFEMYGQVEATSWLTLFSSMSYVQGTDRTHQDNRRPEDIASSRRNDPSTAQYSVATEPLAQIPPFEYRNGVRIHEWLSDPNQAPKWSLEFSARTVMSQNNVATSLGEVPTAGFTIFDIRSYWQATDALLLTAGVENVGNKLYREHLDPISSNLINTWPFYRQGTNLYFGAQVTY